MYAKGKRTSIQASEQSWPHRLSCWERVAAWAFDSLFERFTHSLFLCCAVGFQARCTDPFRRHCQPQALVLVLLSLLQRIWERQLVQRKQQLQ